MIQRSIHALTLVLAAATVTACARSAQQAPAPQSPSVRATTPAPTPPSAATARTTAINPVGIYDFSINAEGMEVTGTITIVAKEGGYGGTVTSSATSGSTISSVAVHDSTITVVASGGDGDATLEFTVSGQTIAGGWAFNGMQGALAGRKRPN